MNPADEIIGKKRKPVGAAVVTAVKLLVLAAILFFLLSRLLGGSRGSSTPFDTMKAAVCSAARLDRMQEADNQMIRRLYGLDPKDYEGVALFYPSTNMGAEELLLVKLADADQMKTVSAAIDARLATQLNTFEGYGAEQTEMLKKSVKELRAGYVLFTSDTDPGAVLRAFDKAY